MAQPNFPKINISVSLTPTSAFPLDGRTLFDSMEELKHAAMTAVEVGSADSNYYFGQLLTYKSINSKTVHVYKIIDAPQYSNIESITAFSKEEYEKLILNVLKTPEITQLRTDVQKLKNPKKGSGLSYDKNSLRINFDENSAINIVNNALTLKLKENSGLDSNENGLSVKPANKSGLKVTENGLAIDFSANSGLKTGDNGLALKLGTKPGLQIGDSGLRIKFEQNSGLQVTNNGIGIKTDNTGNIKFQKTEDGLKGDCCWAEYEQ